MTNMTVKQMSPKNTRLSFLVVFTFLFRSPFYPKRNRRVRNRMRGMQILIAVRFFT